MKDIAIINKVEFTKGLVKFDGYNELKMKVQMIADHLDSQVVTEETISENKKLIAQAKKAVDALNAEKIRIKKELLADYMKFEDQVKELMGIINTSDSTIRDQIKQLENEARELKKEAIQEMYNKRMGYYQFDDLFTIEMFIKPWHLNKSTSLNKVEEDLISWLEQRNTDFDKIKHDEDLIMHYLRNNLNYHEAIVALETEIRALKNVRTVKRVQETETNTFKITTNATKEDIIKALEKGGIKFDIM